MRSAEAPKQTTALIEDSVTNAAAGVKINAEALETFREIDTQVNRVGEVIGAVADGTTRQSQGILQITSGTDQLNAVTQQVAANAEESASAAEELTAQAAQLTELVGTFQLTDAAGRNGYGELRRPSQAAARGRHGALV